MFEKKTVRAFSIVAIVLSVLGLLLSLIGALLLPGGSSTFAFFMGIGSWIILLWASIIGYKLCTSYKLYDEEYKKVGIRVYAIILAFLVFFFIGIIAGLAVSVIILSTLWGLKRNYDEWDYSDTTVNEISTNQDSGTNNTTQNS